MRWVRHPGAFLESLVPARRLTAATFVIVYCVLLIGVPSKLIVRQIGAAGTPANLWGLFALLWWCCATIGGQNPVRRWSPVRAAMLLLTLAVVLSYIASMTRGWYAPSDVRGLTDDVYDLVPSSVEQIRVVMIDAADRGLLSFGAWLGIALVAADGIRTWAELDRVIAWLTMIGGIVAMLGIVQFYVGLDIAGFFRFPGLVANYEFGGVDTRSVVRRVYATANHPIEFGVVIASLLPLAIHRIIHAPRSKAAWFCVGSMAMAIPVSVSRSAILVTGVAIVVLFFGWPPPRRVRAMVAAPVALIGLRLALPGVLGTIASLFSNFGNDPSVSGRTDDYDVVARVWAENPYFGRGLFTFVPRYYRILDNQLLMVVLELGAVGFVAFLGVVLVSFFSARGARRRAPDAEHGHLGLAIAASVAGISASYATFDAWGFPMAAGVTFVLFGLAGAAWQVSTTPVPAAADEVVPVAVGASA